MGWKMKGIVDVCIAWLVLLGLMGATTAVAQGGTGSPATTQITDTLYTANGTAAIGTVLISWPSFSTAGGSSISSGSTSVMIATGGGLSVALVPNAGSTPMGSYYTVIYQLNDGSQTREYWVVPVSSTPVTVSSIRSSVLPTSVAMQTVSKAYVDTSIAAAQLGQPLDVPSPYVLITGSTMTGPLVLPGDPVSALQASDKNYVDEQTAALTAGLAQKVSLVPLATQVIAQPVGTTLGVTNLNGAEEASRFATGAGNNGIANAMATTDCTSGCTVHVEPTYGATEVPQPLNWPQVTHLVDERYGGRRDYYHDPLNLQAYATSDYGQEIDLVETRSAVASKALTGTSFPDSTGLVMKVSALTGGNNLFPAEIEGTVPYFKSNFTAAEITGTYNTEGQHILMAQGQYCYGVGDCLMGGRTLVSSGGKRDNADEGAHPYDLQILEDSTVLDGTCQTGCTPGSTVVKVAVSQGVGTEGEGRYLIDLNPAGILSTGAITGSVTSGRHPIVNFSGTAFPLSTLLETAATIPSQANVMAPGTVTVAIVGSGVPAGYQTNTAALPATSGVACVADANTGINYFETVAYAVLDATHLTMTLTRPHAAGATISVGGLCGYGLEETADTTSGIRQVFPVIGSTTATSLLYAPGGTSVVGLGFSTGAYLNLTSPIAAIARTGNVVTVTTAGNLPVDVNGLTLKVAGVADSSYNGNFVVTTTGANTLTYSETGANSTSAGGSVSYLNGGFALYPMAEVQGVYDVATKSVDGQMTLAANTVAWAANDPVEQPHYFQEMVAPDTEYVTQYAARQQETLGPGIQYQGNNGPGLLGWAINNATPPSVYLGGGGTRTPPDAAFFSTGVWTDTMKLEAGSKAVFAVNCNLSGCGRWDSAYDLFELNNGAGGIDTVRYAPATSVLTYNLLGTQYQFTPQAFTAGAITVGALTATTVNATTINATTINGGAIQGLVPAASLPVFGASGSTHAIGAVPDPGATAGSSRFLREDGTWTTAGGAVSSVNGLTGAVTVDAAGAAAAVQANLNTANATAAAQTAALANVAFSGNAKDVSGIGGIPQRANLLAEYLLNEGTGTVAHDTSGLGNNGTISGATWESTADLSFGTTGEYIQLPVAVNQANTFQFAVYSPPFNNGTPTSSQPPAYGGALAYGNNPSLLCGTDSAHTCLIATSYLSGPKSQRFNAFNSSHTEAKEVLSAGWHIVTIVNGQSGALDHIYYDGAEVSAYQTQGSGALLHPSTGNYQIGGSNAYTGTWWLGKVAAAWAWSTSLAPTDVQAAATAATAYVRGKGGFVNYRGAPHDAGLIVGGIDSRTAGSNGLSSSSLVWLSNLSLTDSTYTTVNLGIPGSMAFDDAAMFDLMYGTAIGSGSGPTITVLWGGVNDFGHLSTRQIANSLRTMVQKAKAAGSRVIVATETSSANSGDASKDALNPIIRAEAFGWGADSIADLATIPQLGADGAYANTTYFADGLHPNNAGELYLDTLFSNVINELIGSNETTNRHQTAATSYQELAGDRFLDLTGTAAQTITLPSCIGYSLTRQIVNIGSATATIAPVSGQTLTGSTSIAVGGRAAFSPIPGSLAAGGCTWERTQ